MLGMNKICFVDVETTGTDPQRHGVIQIAGIIDIDGVSVAEFSHKIKTFDGDEITAEALKANKTKIEDIETYKAAKGVHYSVTIELEKHVDKFDKLDKFQFVGYNAMFDYQFIRRWFEKCGDQYFGSYFVWPPLCVAQMVSMIIDRSQVANMKLATVAKHYGVSVIEDNLHDALYDIRITRELFYLLKERIIKHES